MGAAACPSEAKLMIEKERPDLITLDIHMPEMNGVEFLKSYLRDLKIPVVMVSSVSMSEGPLVMEALSNGAVSYIQKPSLDQLSESFSEILEKLESFAEAKVSHVSRSGGIKIASSFENFDGLIAIGSSTGGPQALETIFTSLPNEIPPIVVTQHIPAVFSRALAERLNGLCQFTIQEAIDGSFLERNHIYIAPGGHHMKLAKRGKEVRIIITDDPPIARFRPSIDYLFDSIAGIASSRNIVGVILTGMGKDGAQGLLKLRKSGVKTLAQDEESSIVYGMPREAFEIGAAEKVCSLSEMAQKIVSTFNSNAAKKAA